MMNVKNKTKTVLKRKDLVAISKVANLSQATLVKWWNGTLPVKPSTEKRIYAAAEAYYITKAEAIKEDIQKLDLIKNRIKETQGKMQLALQALS